jgi:hypothetical protein
MGTRVVKGDLRQRILHFAQNDVKTRRGVLTDYRPKYRLVTSRENITYLSSAVLTRRLG